MTPPACLYTLPDVLRRAAARWPDQVAVVDDPVRLTHFDVLATALAYAHTLREAGVGRGDRVGILLPRSAAAIAAFHGAWLCGAIAVPINERLLHAQVAHVIGNAGAAVVVTDTQHAPLLPPAGVTAILVPRGSASPEGGAGAVVPDPASAWPIGRDVAALLYSSGSTGRPKGIMVTHENLVWGAAIVADYLGLSSDDRLAVVLPLSFDYGLNQVTSAALVGARVVVERSTHPAAVCRTLESEGVTGLPGVPFLWQQLVSRHSPFLSLPFANLRYLSNTGGVVSRPIVERLRTALPHVRLFLMYGLTEAFRSTYLDPAEVDRRPDSIGRAIPNTEILVLDKSGRPCGPDEPGELVHRGPTVAAGYWGDPEATRRTFRPNPLPHADAETVVFSGDLVRRDREGYLYFVGRRDGLLKVRGVRVNPEEIELELRACTAVTDVIAFATSDAATGQEPRIVAAFVGAGGEADRDELARFVRSHLAPHMRPEELIAVDEIPRTPHGKPDRAYAARLWGET